MAKSRNYVEVFKGRPDESGQAWRWRVKSGNGKKVGTAGEAFYNFWTAKRSALRRAVDGGLRVCVINQLDGSKVWIR